MQKPIIAAAIVVLLGTCAGLRAAPAQGVAPAGVKSGIPVGSSDQGQSIEALEKLIAAHPKEARYRFDLGQIYERQGFLTLAHELYQAGLACPAPTADLYEHLAAVDIRLRKLDEATQVATAAVKRWPDDYSVLLTAGYVLHNQRRFSDARKMYEKARDLRPNDPDIYAVLADLYNAEGKFQKAVECADRSLSLLPNFELANLEKGKALVFQGLFYEARGPLGKNFQINPLNFQNSSLYAQVLLQQQVPVEAFKVTLALFAGARGQELAVHKKIAAQLIKQLGNEKVQPLIAEMESAITRAGKPDLAARMHFALGDVYDQLKQPSKAMAQYERGLALNPNFSRGYLRLGEDVQAYGHDPDRAMSLYQKAFSLDHTDPETQARISSLSVELQKRQANPFLRVLDWFQRLTPIP